MCQLFAFKRLSWYDALKSWHLTASILPCMSISMRLITFSKLFVVVVTVWLSQVVLYYIDFLVYLLIENFLYLFSLIYFNFHSFVIFYPNDKRFVYWLISIHANILLIMLVDNLKICSQCTNFNSNTANQDLRETQTQNLKNTNY